MRSLFRRSMSPSMVVALLALVVATAGTSVAAVTLAKNSVGTAQIKNGAVTAQKLSKDRRAAQPVLLSGQLMQGDFGGGGGDSTDGYFGQGITFPALLPTDFPFNQTEYIASGAPYTFECPGPGDAKPGWACFYEGQAKNAGVCCIYRDLDYNPGVGREGTRIYWGVNGTGSYADGVWAVRAP